MPGAIEVGPDSLLKVGPGLAVCPRHRDPMLVHTGAKLRNRLSAILLAASLFFAGDAVDDTGGPAVDRRVDGGHSVGLCGPHLLALLDIVTGGAVPALLHAFALSLGPGVGVRGWGRGHLGSDQLLLEALGRPEG